MSSLQIVGVDEAGVGCLFGDLCAAAVILHDGTSFGERLTDSKKISEKKRFELDILIKDACPYGLGVVSSLEINELGLAKARRLVFHRALDSLCAKVRLETVGLIIVDGTLFDAYGGVPHKCIPKADSLYPCVSAASIVAKTHRDLRLLKWCDENPEVAEHYDLVNNRGYITRSHKEALRKHGFTCWHRKYTVKL